MRIVHRSCKLALDAMCSDCETAHMQITLQKHTIDLDALDRATLPDIEYTRGLLGITYTTLCSEAGINVGTYRRWRLWMDGAEGGSEPTRSSLVAIRASMRRLIEAKHAASCRDVPSRSSVVQPHAA